MLVDLGRNDLGRVCKAGSVKVTDLMRIERYSHVMHIVSTVEGELTQTKHHSTHWLALCQWVQPRVLQKFGLWRLLMN